MKIETPLTKENFWDELYALYPEGTQVFCDWIDEYKKTIGWDELFNHNYLMVKHNPECWPISMVSFIEQPGITAAPKFHDLPHAMQMGIFIEFMRTRGGCSYEVDLFEFDLRTDVTEVIKMLQVECDIDLGKDLQS